MMKHFRNECGIEPKFPCTICGHRFTQKGNLNEHMKRIHMHL